MVEFNNGDSEYHNFLKASSYIQEYTRRLVERNSRKILKIPESLNTVSHLATLVRQFLGEQQELAGKVEKLHDSHRNFNALIKERLDKCKCDMELSVKSILHKDINLEEIKRDDGSNFTIKIPTSSPFTAYMNPSLNHEREAPRLDLELIKMIENGIPPFNDVHTPDESLQFQQPFDNHFFDPSDKRKQSFKAVSARKRPLPHDSTAGPYQCRECEKTFRQKHGLAQHLLTHDSHGAFECDGCGKRYSRQESVYRHQRSTQCTKYQTLTNVRHDEDPGPSLVKNLQIAPGALLL